MSNLNRNGVCMHEEEDRKAERNIGYPFLNAGFRQAPYCKHCGKDLYTDNQGGSV